MRRPRICWILAFCGIAIVTWLSLKPRSSSSWQRLEDGGRIRLLMAQVGPTEITPEPTGGTSSIIDNWFATVSRPKLVQRTNPIPGQRDWLSLWIEWQGTLSSTFPNHLEAVSDLEIRLSDGQILFSAPSRHGTALNSKVGAWRLGRFPIVPWHDQVLNVAFTLNGRRHEMRISNPAYRSDLPSWTPLPLPQSWSDGDLKITLNALNLKWNERDLYKPVRWELAPDWSIQWKEQPAENVFRVSTTVEDVGGNQWLSSGLLGESAWKLKCTARRKENYPFPPNEVRWLGRFDPAQIAQLGDGGHQIYPADGKLVENGIHFAGVLTRGKYEILKGKVTKVSEPEPNRPTTYFTAGLDPAKRLLHVESHRPVYVHQLRPPPEDEFYVWQFDDGRVVNEDYFGLFGVNDDLIKWAPLPDQPFRFGIAKNGLFKFETYVKPPTAPKRP